MAEFIGSVVEHLSRMYEAWFQSSVLEKERGGEGKGGRQAGQPRSPFAHLQNILLQSHPLSGRRA